MRRLAFVRRDAGQTSAARKALLTLAAVLLSLVIPAMVIAGIGYNPWVAFKDLVDPLFENPALPFHDNLYDRLMASPYRSTE